MKLYVVVREDLEPGAQIAQSLHAFREFSEYHPHIEKKWYSESNTIVVLAVPNEEALLDLRRGAVERDIKFAMFREPAMADSLTAISFEPTQITSSFLANLPKAGKRRE